MGKMLRADHVACMFAAQITVHKAALYAPDQGAGSNTSSSSSSWAAASAPREVQLLLHGAWSSTLALPLNNSTAVSAALALGATGQSTVGSAGGPVGALKQSTSGRAGRAWTDAGAPDVFVVTWEGHDIGPVLRVELRVAQVR